MSIFELGLYIVAWGLILVMFLVALVSFLASIAALASGELVDAFGAMTIALLLMGLACAGGVGITTLPPHQAKGAIAQGKTR